MPAVHGEERWVLLGLRCRGETRATIIGAQPNKRLKLAAPGLGRIAFVRQHTSCSFVNSGAPAGWGAAA